MQQDHRERYATGKSKNMQLGENSGKSDLTKSLQEYRRGGRLL